MQLSNAAKPLSQRRTLMLAIASALALGFTGQASSQAFPASINLGSLNGANGFRLDGAAEGDTLGNSVSSAGDVNGDGFDDLIVGARGADPNGNDSGSSYVVFGRNTAFSAVLAVSDLTSLNGFRIDGVAFDSSGNSVSAAGDVNGDGYSDLIVGASRASPNGIGSGSSFVVFGKSTPFAASLQLSSLTGANGFRLDGTVAGEQSGVSVSTAGDINGDGFADIIVGAAGNNPNGPYSGSSYVVFGKNTSFAPTLALSSLDGVNGFRLDGVAARDYSGDAVSTAGDINGDGIDDLIIGAYRSNSNGVNSGSSYVVFGRNTSFPATLALSSLNGENGFRIDGVAANDQSGGSVTTAGDVNGDQIADLIIGAYAADPNGLYSGSSYVVFGKRSPFAATLLLSSLNGVNGFRLDGGAAGDFVGFSASTAGDVNGDSLADLIIGAYRVDQSGSDSGSSYVVFGRRTDFAATIAVSSLTGTDGFRLDGVAANDNSGFRAANAGDINDDGVGDLIISALFADPNGGSSGSSYVVFGRDTSAFKNGFE